ncbi:type II secretion system protein N [Pseudomonas sp. NPDC089401]|uniref:type II secretion system protein N n=1 Tax=Pseudomonas sp. NPDC089401 TaxID=3364462 RepID=UPI00382E14E0
MGVGTGCQRPAFRAGGAAMSRHGLLWYALVFILTLLVELPAAWVARAAGLPLHDVSGSLWQGQARQLGPVGPLSWRVQPWPLRFDGRLGFQGQGWQVHAQGWPWRWQVEAAALGQQVTVATGYRLSGQWQGTLRLQGAGRQCQASDGRVTVTGLALSEPWALGLGQGWVEVACRDGWRLHAQLLQPWQHEAKLEADLLARRASVTLEVKPDAEVTALLRGAQWLGPQALSGQKEVKW